MIWIIILAVVAYLIYLATKGKADLENVNKYGGLVIKYKTLIDYIMSRNAYYQLNEINSNNIELTNTGMKFKLIELDKKLQITWFWNSFSSGKTHKLKWNFDEFESQNKMYQQIDFDINLQSLIDEGMTSEQAKDWLNISQSNDEKEQENLVIEFSKKYPALWERLSN